jgi:ribosome-binding protein aMBF1 (putative translation factor)
MMKNERQYNITKARAGRFAEALSSIDNSAEQEQVDPALIKSERDGVEALLADLKQEINQYEELESTKTFISTSISLEDIPNSLIRARIASGLTHKELARKLELKEQQIQRYEATDYSGANLTRIEDIVDALGIKILLRMSYNEEEFSETPPVPKLIHRASRVSIVRGIRPEHLASVMVAQKLVEQSGFWSREKVA